MGTTINGFVQNITSNDNEYKEESKQNVPSTTNPANNKPPSDTDENTTTDIDDFISQYGSFFSYHSPSKHTKSQSQASSSSSQTQYTLSSEKPLSIQLTPIDIQPQTKLNTPQYSPYSPVTPISPITSFTPPSMQHRRSSTFHNDNQFKIIHGQCQVPSCKAIKRIIKILKWQMNNNNDILIQKVMDNQYDKYLLDDYQHILNDHLFELGAIRKEVNKQIGPCNAAKCVAFARYMDLVAKDLSECDDITFCLDLIDLIHCCIIHFKL